MCCVTAVADVVVVVTLPSMWLLKEVCASLRRELRAAVVDCNGDVAEEHNSGVSIPKKTET